MIHRKIAIYPGTFDPITLGHIDIIKRSSVLVDELIVAVAQSDNKNTLFSLTERVKMIKHEIKGNHINNVSTKLFSGLLTQFVKNENANIIIRGLRTVVDFEHEIQLSYINKILNNSIETIFLPATTNVHFISSTFVKEIARLNGDVTNLVSPNIQTLLMDKCLNRR